MTAVKTTSLFESLISLIAPHYCLGCQREGDLLCDACMVTGIDQDDTHCYRCGSPLSGNALCQKCRANLPFEAVFVAGNYEELLERLIYAYKFDRAKAAHLPLIELLDNVLPQLSGADVVTIPTAAKRYEFVVMIASRCWELGWQKNEVSICYPSCSDSINCDNWALLGLSGCVRQQRLFV